MMGSCPADRPLRVLMVCPQFRPLIGGYERAGERLAHGLIEAGHRVDVVTERRDRAWPRREDDAGLVIHRLWCIPARGIHVASSIVSLAWFLLRRARDYDVVHVHQYGVSAGLCVAITHVRGGRVVLKLTNTGRDGLDATLPRGGLREWIRNQHARVDACVATSERAAGEARAFGIDAARIYRIPNPLDTTHFAPATPRERQAERSRLGLDAAFVAISVSRLSHEKNHRLLIDAWTAFAGKRTDVLLGVLGDGPGMEEIREQVARSPAKHSIRILGSVADPRPWYRAADLFVLSSINEGLSNSLMEALSSGLPMLTTRVSGAEDVASEADVGRVIEQNDRAGMAEALADICTSPDQRAAWGEAARRYAQDRYSLGVVVDATLRMYRAIARKAE